MALVQKRHYSESSSAVVVSNRDEILSGERIIRSVGTL